MKIDKLKGGIAFTRNPLIVSHIFAPDPRLHEPGHLEIVALEDSDHIYSGCFTPPRLEADISGMLDSYASYLPEPTEDDTPVKKVMGYDDLFLSNSALITASWGEVSAECRVCMLPGGVSSGDYRRVGPNIFSERFGGAGVNFFMTTRTAGHVLAIRETELFPLYFAAGEADTFIFRTVGGHEYKFTASGEEYGIYTLNIRALRKWFVTQKQMLPNYFEVWRDNVLSCRIVVTEAERTDERYLLKYRNSYGVFEMLEITGEMSVTPGAAGEEDSSYKTYDSTTFRYTSRRGRTAMGAKLTADTGIRRPYERTALLDMLASEEVWLIGLRQTPVRVIPSAENTEMRIRPEEPERFTLTLTLCDEDRDITPELGLPTDTGAGRLFSPQFDSHFN